MAPATHVSPLGFGDWIIVDPLDANTEAKPPDSKFAQVAQSVGGSERHAVVAADVGG